MYLGQISDMASGMTRRIHRHHNLTKDFFHIVQSISDEAKPQTVLRELETYMTSKKLVTVVEKANDTKKAKKELKFDPSLAAGSNKSATSAAVDKFFNDYM
jgi:hypothetical protein